MQILFVIVRQTYGWNRKKAMIQNKTFVEKTGIIRQHIKRAILKLTELNLIFVTQKGYDIAPTYCFNENCKTWKLVTKKGYSNQKGLQGVTKNGYSELPKMVTSTPCEPLPDNARSDPKDSTKDSTKDNIKLHSLHSANGKAKKVFSPDSFEMDIAERFYNTKREDYPPEQWKFMRKADLQKWAAEIEKLKRLDEKDEQTIYDVIEFALEDDFWTENLRSLSVIRKTNKEGISKFEMIESKMKRFDSG
jgi:phage replication O-like protein O